MTDLKFPQNVTKAGKTGGSNQPFSLNHGVGVDLLLRPRFTFTFTVPLFQNSMISRRALRRHEH